MTTNIMFHFLALSVPTDGNVKLQFVLSQFYKKKYLIFIYQNFSYFLILMFFQTF